MTLGVAVPAAQAQFDFSGSRRGLELTPFGGSRFGGTISFNSGFVNYLTIKSTWDYGAMLDVDVFPGAQVEFMWNRQDTNMDAIGIFRSPAGGAVLDMYQWSLLYQLLPTDRKVHPYLVAGLGFSHIDTGGTLPFSNRFAYNFGGGVKYFFTRHVGLRLEARFSPTQTTESNVVFFDPFFGPFVATVHNYAEQGQANLGLIFRF